MTSRSARTALYFGSFIGTFSPSRCYRRSMHLSVLFAIPEFTDVFAPIGKGIGALPVKFTIPEFTDVFE